MKDKKTYRLLLSGRVQGVGYRYFAEDQAARYEIFGFVRNTYDNKVEIICQGSQRNLELFFVSLKKGPTFANITDFRIEKIKNSVEYKQFEIKY
jgi:acylphosphatase